MVQACGREHVRSPLGDAACAAWRLHQAGPQALVAVLTGFTQISGISLYAAASCHHHADVTDLACMLILLNALAQAQLLAKAGWTHCGAHPVKAIAPLHFQALTA